MKSIFFFIETIKSYQFWCNYLRKLKSFSQNLAAFLKSILIFKHFESKDDRDSFCIFEIVDSENVVR